MKKPKALFMIYLIIAVTFSITLIVPNVKAQEKYCCELTKSGEYCLYTDKYNCKPTSKTAEATCEQTSYCKIGCCYSEDTGYCYPNTPRSRCEALKGTWTADSTCSISQCKKACCMISDQCSFITQTMCKRETSKFPGVKMQFDDSITTEIDCIDKCKSQEYGACVSYDKTCTFTTRESCTETRQEGTKVGFHPNKLCSNPELGTNCAKQQDTKCYQGKVYWFDSCGNRENIYRSDKTLSYNNGYILAEERSCEAKPDDPDCGNCDYSKGNTCGSALNVKPKYGDNICRDVNCKTTTESKASPDATGGSKKHGESWCLYETAVGFGQDPIGSRHLKSSCINGEEIIEPCRDFREEFCIQTVSGGKPISELGSIFNLGQGFSEALCKENRFSDCAPCNLIADKEEKTECCTDIRTKDCFMFGDTCAPIVKPGLGFWTDATNFEAAKKVCETGNSICDVKWEKPRIELEGGKQWKCTKNCQCLTPDWLKYANQKCVVQGDCGAYYNIEGEFTNDGIKIISSSGMTKLPSKITEDMVPRWESIVNPSIDSNKFKLAIKDFWLVGSVGAFTSYALIYATIYTYFNYWVLPAIGEGFVAAGGSVAAVAAESPAAYTFGEGFTQAGGTGVFEFLGEMAAGRAGTAIVGKTVAATSGLEAAGIVALNVLGFLVFWVAVAYLLVEVINVVGGPKTKRETVQVICQPWEPPEKTDDCEKCDIEKVPCSEYRCKSLGKFCGILNEGTENEKCTYINPYDTTSPVIQSAQKDYKYTETDNGYTLTEEIPSFTPVTLAITTNEFAKCQFSLEQNIPYKQMEVPFGDTFWTKNHTITFSLPSELQEEAALKLTNGGKYTLYIKCIDEAGNDNKKDYYIKFKIKPGPDFTPPKIELTSISNNAYVASNLEKIPLSVYLNEPSKCRWSSSDQDYTAMTNTFTCVESGFDITSINYGLYECTTEVPIEKTKTNNYFFRCIDRDNNVNVESYPYTLISTIPLKITSTKPTGVVYSANPVLEIKTLEGADNGIAFCGFSNRDEPITSMIAFLETNSTEHKQQLSYLPSKIYLYYVQCIDKAGNSAKSKTTFEVQADLTPPEISRIYKDLEQNVLVIELTEKTKCEYSFESFNYGSGLPMTGLNELIHKTTLENLESNIFYIICQDEYQNQIDFRVIT